MEKTAFSLGEDRLMQGVLALAISLSRITKDALRLDSLHRMQKNGMSEEEVERWRESLMDLDAALDQIKGDERIRHALGELGRPFDSLIGHLLLAALEPEPFAVKKARGPEI